MLFLYQCFRGGRWFSFIPMDKYSNLGKATSVIMKFVFVTSLKSTKNKDKSTSGEREVGGGGGAVKQTHTHRGWGGWGKGAER